MNFNNFTIKSQEAIQEAVNLVKSRGQQAIEPVHIMQGVMKVGENVTNFIFQKLGMNGQQVAVVVDKQIDSLPKVSGGEPYLSREANDVLQKATQYSNEKGCKSKVVIGGACITQSFADEIGADGYSKDAAECVKLVERLLNS